MKRTLLLLLLLLLGVCARVQATTYYIGQVSGASDSNAGTDPAAPWATFATVNNLFPGDTLLVMDGVYNQDYNGGLGGLGGSGSISPIMIDCSAGARNGTGPGATQQITVKAQHERQARIHGMGNVVIGLANCSWWVIEGFTVTNHTCLTTGFSGDGIYVLHGTHNTIRRNLLDHPTPHNGGEGTGSPHDCGNGRGPNSHGILIEGFGYPEPTQNLIEENEVYGVCRHSIVSSYATGDVRRRNYVHGRFVDGNCDGRDVHYPGSSECISVYPGGENITENNVVEDCESPYSWHGEPGHGPHNQWYGNVALNSRFGFSGGVRGDRGCANELCQMPQDYVFKDNLSLGVGSDDGIALSCVTCKNLQIQNHSILDSLQTGPNSGGVSIRLGSSDPNGDGGASGEAGDGAPTVYVDNLLMFNNPGAYFGLDGQADWYAHNLMFGTDEPSSFNPPQSSSGYANVQFGNPGIGTCKIYRPVGSAARNAGVGADIVNRYENGVLTNVPLWDPTTSEFPCGAVITGRNDDPSNSCIGIREKLNVNFGGCTVPLEGGGTGYVATIDTYHLQASGTQTDCELAKSAATPYSVTSAGSFAAAFACGLGTSTYILHAGTYPGLQTTVTPIPPGASLAAPTTVRRQGTDVVTLPYLWLDRGSTSDQYLTFDGFVFNPGNVPGYAAFMSVGEGANGIVVQNSTLTNATYEVIYWDTVSNSSVLNSTIQTNNDATHPLIALVNSANATFRGDTIASSLQHGLVLDGASPTALIEKNQIRNNAGTGIISGSGTTKVYNNLVWQNGTGLSLGATASGAQAYYNTIWGSTTACMVFAAGVTTSQATNNICFASNVITNNAGGGVTLATNQTADPSFASVTPASPNFLHLNPVAPATSPVSVARNAGTPIASLTSDFLGNPRPRSGGVDTGVDQGAYEEVPVTGGVEPPPAAIGLVPPFRTTHFLIPQP